MEETPLVLETLVQSADAIEAAVAYMETAWVTEPPDLDRILNAIDRVARTWQTPEAPERSQVLEALHAHTGLHPMMLAAILDEHLRMLRRAALTALLQAELGNPRLTEGFQTLPDYGHLRLHTSAPGLRVWWMPGNLPGPALLALAFSLITRGPFLIRVSRNEPVLASVFWQALVAVEPDFAPLGLIVWWPHEDDRTTRRVLALAHTVLAYGNESTLHALRTLTPGTARWFPYPHRISFAIVGQETLRPNRMADLADRLAEDVAWFDQQGCMSPHTVYLETSDAALAEAFADALAQALDQWERRWPRRRLQPEEAMRVWNFRAHWMADPDAQVWMSEGTAWTIILSPKPALEPTCTYRTVLIKTVPDLNELPDVLGPQRHHLQTVGYAMDRTWDDLARRLARLGVKRFCPLGFMQRPPLVGCHDGRPRLLDLIEWTQWESP